MDTGPDVGPVLFQLFSSISASTHGKRSILGRQSVRLHTNGERPRFSQAVLRQFRSSVNTPIQVPSSASFSSSNFRQFFAGPILRTRSRRFGPGSEESVQTAFSPLRDRLFPQHSFATSLSGSGEEAGTFGDRQITYVPAAAKRTKKRSKLLSKALEEVGLALSSSDDLSPSRSANGNGHTRQAGSSVVVEEIAAVDSTVQEWGTTTRKRGTRTKTKRPRTHGKPERAASAQGKEGGVASGVGAGEEGRVYVLDTNVILHDSSCVWHFGKNDVVIPITVLEELDKFKKGNEVINFHAREFLREVDELSTGEVLFGESGVALGQGLGRIRVALTGRRSATAGKEDVFRQVFYQDTPDHRILDVVYTLANQAASLATAAGVSDSAVLEAQRSVILVSKDVNLRMKARSLGLAAQDYVSDRDVTSVNTMYTGKRVVDDVPLAVIDTLYREGAVEGAALEQLIPNAMANEFFILKAARSKSVLAMYNSKLHHYRRVSKDPAYRIAPRNAEQAFGLAALLDPSIPLVTVAGAAGTGKTLLALAAALEQQDRYQQIYLARPIVPLSNRDIGYLPGDMNAKIDPYMQPLYDNLGVIKHQFATASPSDSDRDPKQSKKKAPTAGGGQHIKDMLDSEKLVITPLAYIRGRSFQEVFFIVDEAQNLTPLEVKTIITRAGEGTKVIFTGDIQQIDTPYLDRLSNGLSYLINRMSGQPLYAHVTLEKGERSTLAKIATQLL